MFCRIGMSPQIAQPVHAFLFQGLRFFRPALQKLHPSAFKLPDRAFLSARSKELAMPEYEIRVLKDDRYCTAVIHAEILMDDETAIHAASRLAGGAAFEVWRDLDCVYGLASARPMARAIATRRRI